jgi:hypothetical protein
MSRLRWSVGLAVAVASVIAPVAARASSSPIVEHEAVNRLSSTDATLTAKINGGGLETHFEMQMFRSCPDHYGSQTTCEFVEQIPMLEGSLPPSDFSQLERVRLSAPSIGVTLSPGSEYSYGTYATNSLGSTHGPRLNFIPPFPGLPAVYPGWVSGITPRSAVITDRINPEGSEVAYEVWLLPGCQEGGCERFGPHVVATGHIAAGSVPRSFQVKVTNLVPGEPNDEYWVTATNANGTSEGAMERFATPKLASG